MKRKVSRVGPATLCVSLPSKWVKANGIQKGDEVEVVEVSDGLSIKTNPKVEIKEAIIQLSGSGVFSRRLIYIPYIRGYNSIKILFNTKEELDLIRRCTERILGFELVEQGDGFCRIKNVAEGIEGEFKTISNRLVNMTISMGEDLHDILKKGELHKLESLIEQDKLANKLTRFCKRMINKNLRTENTPIVYRIHCLLEEIMDDYREIGGAVLSNKNTTINKPILDIFKETVEMTKLFRHLNFKFDDKSFLEFVKRERKLKEISTNLFVDTNGLEAEILSRLRSIIDKHHHLVEDLY